MESPFGGICLVLWVIHGCITQADFLAKNVLMHFLAMYFFLQNNFWPPWCYDAESTRGERETIEHLSSAGGNSMQEIDGIGYSNTYHITMGLKKLSGEIYFLVHNRTKVFAISHLI